jgi:hypothetical protein
MTESRADASRARGAASTGSRSPSGSASGSGCATVIWGVYDTIAPIRVATHVWHEHLMYKPGRNALYLVPGANHYVQNDRPEAFVRCVLHTVEWPEDAAPGALTERTDAPILVDRSRTELPDAAQLIAQRAAVPDQAP